MRSNVTILTSALCICLCVQVQVQSQPMAQAAAQQPAAAAAAAGAAPRPVAIHKSTAIIPGWSRPLSSQSLTIECQKISQPSRSASAKESYGVMELEVMKFVAYCGGLTIKLRLDDLQHGHVDRSVPAAAKSVPPACFLLLVTAPHHSVRQIL